MKDILESIEILWKINIFLLLEFYPSIILQLAQNVYFKESVVLVFIVC